MLRTTPRPIATLLTSLAAILLATPALAGPETSARTLCVFDPSGANGNVFNLVEDFAVEAIALGVKLTLKPYTDEATAARDFKAGQCDAALLTGTRVRAFQPFTSTMEALGALPDYATTERVIKSLAKPAAGKLMRHGDYETAALLPGGSVFLFVTDRAVDTVGELAGKKVATLTHDDAAMTMVKRVGAAVTGADIGSFASMFNNGSVDASYAPAYAYKALELYKGIGQKGGIIRYPIAQLTMQIVIRSERFPDDFGARARALAATKFFDKALALSRKSEAEIPAGTWIDIPATDKARYDELLREVRLSLKPAPYDPTMLALLKKARCKADRARAECVL